MAGEEVFTASAIHSVALMGTLLYLHHRAENEFWRHIWLFGVFWVAVYSVTLDMWNMQHTIVDADLANLSYSMLQPLIWVQYLLLGYIVLLLCMMMFNKLIRDVKGLGEAKHGKSDQPNEDIQ